MTAQERGQLRVSSLPKERRSGTSVLSLPNAPATERLGHAEHARKPTSCHLRYHVTASTSMPSEDWAAVCPFNGGHALNHPGTQRWQSVLQDELYRASLASDHDKIDALLSHIVRSTLNVEVTVRLLLFVSLFFRPLHWRLHVFLCWLLFWLLYW